MNTYQCSDGTRVKQSLVERKITTAKEMKLQQMRFEHGYVFCEECGANENTGPLDCSHEISVKEAKESGRTELCWSVSNIKIRCRKCHQVKDKLNLQYSKNEHTT